MSRLAPPNTATDATADPHNLRDQPAAALMPLSRQPLPEDNPDQQGWQIETFNVNAGNQLKHLDDLWTDSHSLQAAQEFVHTDFHCRPLRPLSLTTVYDQRGIQIRRVAATDPGDRDTSGNLSGPAGLLNAFREMTSSVRNARAWRSKEKIFGVQLEGNRAETDVYYQLYAEHDGGTLQVNATWKCTWQEANTTHPQLSQIAVVDYEEVVSSSGAEPQFVDRTVAVLDGSAFTEQLQFGVDHWLTRLESRLGIDIGGWQGLAVGDVNGDGLEDVYVTQPGGLPNRLFVQNADGTATERAADAGVDWLDSCHAALFVDLDNDLDQDLLVAVSAGILVMSNDGRGHFSLRATKLTPAALPYSLAAADFDVDGDLDIYVCCYNPRQGVNRHILFARPVPYHDANNGGPNVLLENGATPTHGPWQFNYVTHRVGLYDNNQRFSYAAAWEDYDNDGDLDLYVANDFGRNNLYRNDQGVFRDVAGEAGVEDIGPGMSCCWGDYDNDGWMDLYVSNMFSSAGNRITDQNRFHESADAATREAFRRHARGNSLFANQRDGSFRDVSIESGVVLGRWAWGSHFADLNNDGLQDLVVTNGFITQADTGDL